MPEAVHHKNGLGMNGRGDLDPGLAHGFACGITHAHPVAGVDASGLGLLVIDPHGIFRNLLKQQRIIDGMALCMHGHPPKGNAVGPLRRRNGRRIGGQHVLAAALAVAIAGQFHLARGSGEGIICQIHIQRIAGERNKALFGKVRAGEACSFKLKTPHVLRAFKNQRIKPEALCQTADNFPVGLGVITRRDNAVAHKELRFEAVLGGNDAFARKIGGERQHYI